MTESSDGPGETRWSKVRQVSGEEYAAHFAELARSGRDVHGEASFVAALVDPGARVLDAGCGTGRVGIRLHELGYDVVGADVDESMLEVARRTAPQVPWCPVDISRMTAADLGGAADSDVVVMAGNVVPLLGEGSLPRTMRAVADLLRPGGLVVAGFGLDPAHLPPGCPVTPLSEYDEACRAAGLSLRERFSSWEGATFEPSSEYAVSVHVLGSAP
jgi:SAM-dependent methyltransferase